jgi:hypothetical protein
MKIEIHQNGSRKHSQYFSSKKVTVGSGSDSDLVIPEEQKVGANLITIEEVNGEIFVTDAGSESGAFIQGNALNLNEKTKLMTIFPLEIGVDLSLFITDENETEVIPVKIELPHIESKSRVVKQEESRTSNKAYSAGAKNKVSPKAVDIKTQPKVQPSKNTLIMIAIFILGGVGFAYYKIILTQKSKIVGAEATKIMGVQVVAATPEPVTQLYDGLNFHTKRELIRMQNIYNGNLCSTEIEKNLCKSLDLNFDYGEGVVINNDVIYIFAPFDELFNRKQKLLQSDHPENLVHQILLLDYVLSSKFKPILDLDNISQINLVTFKVNSKNDFLLLNLFILNKLNFSTIDHKLKNDILEKASHVDDLNVVLNDFQSAYVNWNFGSPKQVR